MTCPNLRRVAPTLLICLLLACLPGVLRAQASDWSVRVTPFNQVFPALELSQARSSPAPQHEREGKTHSDPAVLGSGSGLIALRLRALHDNEPIYLTISAAPWLRAPTHFAATLAHAGRNYELHPILNWDIERLATQSTALATTLQFALDRDGILAGTRIVAISLRPLNDALYFVRDGRDSVDLSWIFAAYVNANDAVVERMLDTAVQSGIVEKFTGYADADPGQVLRQAWAVWHAVTAHGIRYSGADPGIDRGPSVFSQRVRFLADTWNDRSANCIDGSALLVSALQRIGLRSFLVLIPAHAFVGFYTDAAAEHAAYLETTLLGDRPALPATTPSYADELDLSAATRSSLASFDAALRAGAARYARNAGKLDGRHRPDYAIIDIAAARGFGIRPISIRPVTTAMAGGR
ncbi:MAG: hypothetical protein ACREPT_11625 [Rudaea sp.]